MHACCTRFLRSPPSNVILDFDPGYDMTCARWGEGGCQEDAAEDSATAGPTSGMPHSGTNQTTNTTSAASFVNFE